MSKLLWIRRRARRIMTFYGLEQGVGARRVAVAEASKDWQAFNPGK